MSLGLAKCSRALTSGEKRPSFLKSCSSLKNCACLLLSFLASETILGSWAAELLQDLFMSGSLVKTWLRQVSHPCQSMPRPHSLKFCDGHATFLACHRLPRKQRRREIQATSDARSRFGLLLDPCLLYLTLCHGLGQIRWFTKHRTATNQRWCISVDHPSCSLL